MHYLLERPRGAIAWRMYVEQCVAVCEHVAKGVNTTVVVGAHVPPHTVVVPLDALPVVVRYTRSGIYAHDLSVRVHSI